ncbi:MAG: hypothetical protein H7Y18_12040 [Clostridiaceae bacterium]|nr:hypothetical protein [Clostridiaceae bacterium]
METMKQFTFYPRYISLQGLEDVKVGNKLLNELTLDEEMSLGSRQVGDRSYHIFYFKNDRFSVYYHKGGLDAMYSSKSLDEVLDYVNKLSIADFL